MRDYGKVYTAFWTSEDIRSMSEDARTLAFYLLTCPHGNMLGCFRLSNAYAGDDLKWELERVSKGFEELYEKGFAYRCNKTFWVLIRQYLEWNQFENPNVGKAAAKLFDAITPPDDLKAALAVALREYSATFPSEKLDEFEAESEPFENPFKHISKTRTRTRALTTTGAGTKPKRSAPDSDEYTEDFEQAWTLYPTRPGASKKESYKAWKARLNAGVSVDDLIAGIKRYAAYVAAMKTDPQYIKQAVTFLGPGEHYKADWTIQPRASPTGYESAKDRSRREAAEKLTGRSNHEQRSADFIDINEPGSHFVG